jgi:hypothetical protein
LGAELAVPRTAAEQSDHRQRRLLRARRERPSRRAAEQRDELATLDHSITSSSFGVGMTRLVNEQNIRTPQRIENRACNDPGILTSDVKPIFCGLSSMRVMRIEYSIRN